MKETEIAAPVVEFLQVLGWDVYQEVHIWNRTADIVGRFETTRGRTLIWIIEVKRSLGLAVLDQAVHWKDSANFISTAVPMTKRGLWGRPQRPFVAHFVERSFGLGRFEVEGNSIEQVRAPDLNRKTHASLDWETILVQEQKESKAGTAGGGYWTPFKGTCDMVRTFARQNPGRPFREVIEEITHHYTSDASARSSLRTLIDRGVVKGVRLEKDGRRLLLFPEGS